MKLPFPPRDVFLSNRVKVVTQGTEWRWRWNSCYFLVFLAWIFSAVVSVLRAFQMVQWWRICLLTQETQVPSLCPENPLEKGTATHSSIPAWRIPGTEGQRVGHDWVTSTFIFIVKTRTIQIYPEGSMNSLLWKNHTQVWGGGEKAGGSGRVSGRVWQVCDGQERGQTPRSRTQAWRQRARPGGQARRSDF